MLSEFSYPIVCTEKFSESVAFYEDHFHYAPAFEMDGFVILKRTDIPDTYLAVIDSEHDIVPEEYRKSVQGMILSYPVDDAEAAHQKAYMDGLNIVMELSPALCGRKHCMVEDPNGILIDIAENIDLDALLSGYAQDKAPVVHVS